MQIFAFRHWNFEVTKIPFYSIICPVVEGLETSGMSRMIEEHANIFFWYEIKNDFHLKIYGKIHIFLEMETPEF